MKLEAFRIVQVLLSVLGSSLLIPFLMDWRTLVVSLTALPLSLLLGLLALNWLGQGLNTMTLGGLAVAIGSAVDDAIVDAENVHRSLRENLFSSQRRSPLQVVFTGCQEVRDSLFGATLITVVVFSPIFALSGVEGRIFTPMGIAYLVAVLASSLTALTVTPFGVATRNGLLLVDNYNAKFAEGMVFKEAIIQGSMERLNAILMTAFTSALGLAPLVVGSGAGKEILQPLAVVVLGGLFTSTALTLLVLPALYAQFGKTLIPQTKPIQSENFTPQNLPIH